SFAHYPSYAHDAQTGKWSLQSYQADALLDRFWSYGIRNSSETVVFHLAAEGDARTGVWTPVLRFYDIDGNAINARAVSLLMDGVRYELSASSAQVQNGRYRAECISVPLAEDGLAMVEKLMTADSVTVRLHGDRMHTTAITREASASRAALEAASLALLEGDYALITELGAKQYGLWDLSAIAWENEHGYRPALQQSAVIQLLGEAEVDDEMGMVLPDESGEAVQAAQQALIDSGFLSGTPARTFDDSAVEAVLRAQKYLGRIPTGCFDQALMEALAQGRTEIVREEVPMYNLGETAQIMLRRYWFADSVSASENADSRRSVANTDHVLLAADGLICNMSAKELHLFMDVEASVVYNGQYAYEAELVCESSGGAELDSRLLPLAQARLIVYAEIPETLATDAQAQWSIVLSADGENLAIELQ
ncbi:MAG: peptidoglycan-binding protein, partial [Clostridia bacterium]|nr:peptidoglycan-binding protein [Clostridia bacterium]